MADGRAQFPLIENKGIMYVYVVVDLEIIITGVGDRAKRSHFPSKSNAFLLAQTTHPPPRRNAKTCTCNDWWKVCVSQCCYYSAYQRIVFGLVCYITYLYLFISDTTQ